MNTSIDNPTLAINGGSKTRTTPLPVRKLFGIEEKQAMNELFDRAMEEGCHILGYNGEQEDAYCHEFAEFLGGGFADGVNSGTNAVYLALRALELEPFGEVIVSPITDPGGAMPIALCNLVPVAADSAPGSFNTCAEEIAKKITPLTRAILVAHISGLPVDMDPILELARKHKLPVIEDCAQCHGAKYKGRHLGTLGDIAAFSTMFGKHHSTGGQGGVVFTKSERLYWKIRQHADRGKPFGIQLAGGPGAGVGAAASAGGNVLAALNCNMDELHACIGRVQLRKLPAFLEARRSFVREVVESMKDIPGVRLVTLPRCEGCKGAGSSVPTTCELGCEPAYWFLIFEFDERAFRVDKQTFVNALQAEGLPFEPTYLFVPVRQPWAIAKHAFGHGESAVPWDRTPGAQEVSPLPNVEAADASHFRIVFHEGWGRQEASDLVSALRKIATACSI